MFRRIFIYASALLLLVTACRNKKPSLTGDEPVQFTDFSESFPEIKVPYQFRDTLISRKEKDSTMISYNVFLQFIPDSVVAKVFGKGAEPKLYPMGRLEVEDQETYLLAKAVQGEKKAAFILGFDKEEKFVAGMPLLHLDKWVSTQQFSGIDRKYSIYRTLIRRNGDGSLSEGKEVYIFSPDAGQFIMIMTDALDDKPQEVINPIDTLPKKNKTSGDYQRDKQNFVSIRDASRPNRFAFFIHFEKNKGKCVGELKGEADFVSANTAVYRQAGDPCVLHFSFSSSTVTLKEIEGCGARRDLDCSFDGSYSRKKAPKAVKKKT